ncbi:hypothetical protein EST38_g2961 [Candolleomyces aberdarensis]|uniref:Post-GPI attachment to proteins factor 3 n=1 Tax=Candolleomyces aberdarensis TaxID=2316362 RepID=A0A4Q2DR86_9AGAR|nr:hypothetical protein EST38_g2961 [Candolleomyces aberdarensis]
MHSITTKAISSGRPMEQYYGKWPFWRYAGMQEPASVVFSVFNFWAHWKGFKTVETRLPNDHPVKNLYLGWAVLSMNAWIWSAVFHTRDLPITEKLDYFSAVLPILSALYFTFIRLFHLYRLPSGGKLTNSCAPSLLSSLAPKPLLAITFLLTYLGHITYLTSGPRFNYHNSIFNLVIGLPHDILWIFYFVPLRTIVILRRYPNRPKTYRPPFAWKAGLFVALATAATGLGVFDFPLWARVLDSHAMWHAVTSPIAGDKVIATARGSSTSKLADLKDKGAVTLELDVTASLERLSENAKEAVEIYGRVDVVVNNAGYLLAGTIEECTPEETVSQFK